LTVAGRVFAAVWKGWMVDQLIAILTNSNPGLFLPVALALAATFTAIYLLRGRAWALLYVALIPFLNWSFGVIPEFPLLCTADMIAAQRCAAPIFGASEQFAKGVSLHPMTIVTGLVFVVRDFVQREMGHRVLAVMLMAVAWSFFYAWPVIALASGIAFAISETVDWLLFTFTKYRLSTRILLSSALAAPVDTTVFLYGADLAKQMQLGLEPGNSLHLANWVVFVIGKMIGAVVVSAVIRRREDAGKTDPASA
jgi:uncharacterized PurR-regulated membrane protein YhhQ (DUF165 family)